MERTTRTNRRESTARQAAETALDVAVGGTALAADKAIETADEAVDRAAKAFREGRRDARESAASATRAVRKAISPHDGRAYEDRTRDELYALAQERDIVGRSSMRKAELIRALRAEQS